MMWAFGDFVIDMVLGLERASRADVYCDTAVPVAEVRRVLEIRADIPVSVTEVEPLMRCDLDAIVWTGHGLAVRPDLSKPWTSPTPLIRVDWQCPVDEALDLLATIRRYPELAVEPATMRYLNAAEALMVARAESDPVARGHIENILT